MSELTTASQRPPAERAPAAWQPETWSTLVAAPQVRSAFDGLHWRPMHADGTLWVAPPLVDAGCGVAGYRESLMDPLLRAARAITALLQESGIGALRVSASSWAEYWHFQSVLRASQASVQITGGGPYLVIDEPDSDRQRWIRTRDDLHSAADLSAAEGVQWLNVQTVDPVFAQDAAAAARERGLRVALRGNADVAEVLAAGDLLVGLPNLVRSTTHDSALSVLSRWADPDAAATAQAQARDVLGRGVAISTELLNLHRTVFVRDSLSAPFLEENEPILPHVRWLLQMRRGASYFGGRGTLAEHTGLVEPKRAEAKVAELGWQRLQESAAALFAAPSLLLPASTSPQLTQLPGFGLKEELVVLHGAGVGLDDVLARASDPRPIGVHPPASSVLATSTDPGHGARFLTSLRPSTLTQFHDRHDAPARRSA